MLRTVFLAVLLSSIRWGLAVESLPANTWVQLAEDKNGARRNSSLRFVDEGSYFLLWGFLGHVTEFYGFPEEPLLSPPEYDVVHFDLNTRVWQNHLPFEKAADWSKKLPPLHMCASYQGITTGSHRPQLKIREGVLRPDLNITFDQVTYDSKRHRMVYFTGGRTLAYDVVGRVWSDVAPNGGPPPVAGGSLLYLPERDEILLYGGGYVAESGPDNIVARGGLNRLQHLPGHQRSGQSSVGTGPIDEATHAQFSIVIAAGRPCHRHACTCAGDTQKSAHQRQAGQGFEKPSPISLHWILP